MKIKNLITFLVLILSLTGSSQLYAEDRGVSLSSPEDKLHALALTRFHFITLKQFQSALFRFVDQKKEFSKIEAGMLNAGLNQFLSSAERETVLLEALRQNQPVTIEFPDVNQTIEVKPLLDKPIAFQITLTMGEERHFYDVDWSGNVIPVN